MTVSIHTSRGSRALVRSIRGMVVAVVLVAGITVGAGGAAAADLVVYIPRDFTAEVGVGGTALLRWRAPSVEPGVSSPAVSYNIFSNNALVATVQSTAAQVTYTTEHFAPGLYVFQIQAVDASGVGSGRTLPDEVRIIFGDNIAPAVPMPIVTVRQAATRGLPSRISVSWVLPIAGARDVKTIEVYDNGALVTNLVGFPSTFSPPFGRHAIQLVTIDYAGNRSVRSAPVRVTTQSPPPAPVGVTATLVGGTWRLTWTQPAYRSPIDGYTVYVNGGPGFFCPPGQAGCAEPFVDLSVLAPGARYFLQVSITASQPYPQTSVKSPPIALTIT